jgi:hypothetical protein
MASLPVDRSKTEPKPAYYKLQFGDDVTGFSYYVRTLAVMIGRNCVSRRRPDGVEVLGWFAHAMQEKPVPLPPPAITSPSVPPIPPLEDIKSDGGTESKLLPEISESILNTPSVADFPTPPGPSISASSSPEATPFVIAPHLDMISSGPDAAPVERFGDALGPVSKGQDSAMVIEEEAEQMPGLDASALMQGIEEGIGADGQEAPVTEVAVLLTEQVAVELEDAGMAIGVESVGDGDQMPEDSQGVPEVKEEPSVPFNDAKIKVETELGPLEIAVEAPPPPPTKVFVPVEHVDVDLGPLKSVSRNHAKIEYRADLGHFCLEIFGRNGAWVDDRYYVKGSTVPLNQG